MTIRVGITGQDGFIGSHLIFKLQLQIDEVELIPFKKEYFTDKSSLVEFVSKCDCIVHLAALNKGVPNEVYDCNVALVRKLIIAMEEKQHSPHVIFSSSIQEINDTLYGASKKKGRVLLSDWSKRTGGKLSCMLIENVFGAFGVPFYNSVVATFCHQLTHDQDPEIEKDTQLKLVYVDDLAEDIYRVILDGDTATACRRPVTRKRVSEILSMLQGYRDAYIENNTIPVLSDRFEVSLFNTFRSYLDYEYFPVRIPLNTDERGWLVEAVKADTGGQSFFSVTKPGITRGNHYHTRKVERFCVVRGEAIIKIKKIDSDRVIEYTVSGDQPCFVDMPIFHTHNITNVGEQDLLTLFWCNEIFDQEDADTWFREV